MITRTAPSVSRVDTVFLPVRDLERATHRPARRYRARDPAPARIPAGPVPLALQRLGGSGRWPPTVVEAIGSGRVANTR